MRRRWLLPLLLCTALVLGGSAPAPPLADRIDALLQQWQANDAFWGVSVYDIDAGEMLYSRNADRGFLPASNQKLLTTAAALDLLGSTHRYETSLHFNGTTDGSLMRGDLMLDGTGDPTFGSLEMRTGDPLEAWAERLADMGVERIEGRLIGNDNAFDGRPYPDGWSVNYITRQKGRHLGASAGALSYRDNVVPLTIDATQPGQPPRAAVQPPGIVSVDNRATTSARWRGSTLQVERTFSTNELVLTGSVARSYDGSIAVPVSDPTAFTLRSFQHHLAEAGIETDLRLVDVDTIEDPPARTDPLFVSYSPPLAEIISVINKESNNFYAEQVFRSFGWGGSTRGAARRAESFLQSANIDARHLRIADGSGLSRKNLITPRALVRLLAHMTDHPAQEAFQSSLARGGERNTTLDYRLNGAVSAKTGSLEFVRALSGYTERPNGNRVAFVLFANNYTGPSYQITQTIDAVVEAIRSVAA
jgi:D-alanyl-D-alanine carboxypeptidase/D-alanyl-D-alanine-endopeptidase (penicillin-binding protein 4)